MLVEKLVVIRQCSSQNADNNPYYHPFKKEEVVEVVSRKSGRDRNVLCTNGKESAYLSEFDVEDTQTHYYNKMLERAKDFKQDIVYDLENDEDTLIEKRDVETISWLIEQAKRTDMYKSCLEQIVRENGSGLPATLLAQLSLNDAEQRFNRKVKEETS